jgi:hypothetical protein
MPGSFFSLDLHSGFYAEISLMAGYERWLRYIFGSFSLFALFRRTGFLDSVS